MTSSDDTRDMLANKKLCGSWRKLKYKMKSAQQLYCSLIYSPYFTHQIIIYVDSGLTFIFWNDIA